MSTLTNLRSFLCGLLWPLSIALSQTAGPDSMAVVRHAYELQQNGDYAGAAEAYREFLKLHPDEVGAHSNLGVVLTKLGRFHEAIKEYQAAQSLLPNDARITVNLALAYEKAGMLLEATKRLEALHEASPQEKQVTVLLADAYLQAGENRRVIELLQPLQRQSEDDLGLAYLLGTALIREHRVEEGQTLLERIMKDGDSAEARFLLGMQMYESGDYPASVKQFASASEVNPNLPELQAYYGEALLITGDADGAAAAFRRELGQNPYNYAANSGLGQILTVRKDFAAAEPLLTQALVMRPQSADVALALGTCLSAEGKLTEARRQLQNATKAAPNAAEAHQRLADVDTRLRFTTEAGRERSMANQLRRSAESKSSAPGPRHGEFAPAFSLADVATGRKVSLQDFRGKSPVVLIFGSYTCPNFRNAASALRDLQAKYGAKAAFLLIYIREAHGAGDWQSTRNSREIGDLPPARLLSERQDHASMCVRTLHFPFPALLDGPDNGAEASYGAWPSRAFVIDRYGRVRYSTRLTELDFSPSEMDAAIRAALIARRATPQS